MFIELLEDARKMSFPPEVIYESRSENFDEDFAIRLASTGITVYTFVKGLEYGLGYYYSVKSEDSLIQFVKHDYLSDNTTRLDIKYPMSEEQYFQLSTVQDIEFSYEEILELPKYFRVVKTRAETYDV